MKREDIEAIVGTGVDKDVVTKLLDAMHAEITPYKDAAKKAQDDLAAKVAEIGELTKKTGDAEALQKSLKELQDKYEADTKAAAEKMAQIEFEGVVREVVAKYGAKNEKAVKALLDLDKLKDSKNQRDDLDAAVKALTESDAYLFGAAPTSQTADVGGKITSQNQAQVSGVEAAFLAKNPGLKI